MFTLDILIIGNPALNSDHSLLLAACQQSQRRAAVVTPDQLSVMVDERGSRALLEGREVHASVLLPRGVNRVFGFIRSWLEVAEAAGAVVINPIAAAERCLDKLVTARALHASEVPTLPTFGTVRPVWPEEFTGPLVYKPAFGSGGRGVQRVAAIDEIRQEPPFGPGPMPELIGHLVAQPYASGAGCDHRVFVIDGQAVAVTTRTAPDGTFITNGSRATVVAGADPAVAALGVQAAEALGLRYAGVDIIVHDDAPMVLEVNCWPGIAGTTRATGVDLAAGIVEAATQR